MPVGSDILYIPIGRGEEKRHTLFAEKIQLKSTVDYDDNYDYDKDDNEEEKTINEIKLQLRILYILRLMHKTVHSAVYYAKPTNDQI